jgi:hypothetical protein
MVHNVSFSNLQKQIYWLFLIFQKIIMKNILKTSIYYFNTWFYYYLKPLISLWVEMLFEIEKLVINFLLEPLISFNVKLNWTYFDLNVSMF